MSKLRPFMGPSRSEKKANRPLPRIEQENTELDEWLEDIVDNNTISSMDQFMAELALAQYRRMGEMVRHLQEIEGRAHRGR